jgi:hypothetical protein
VERKHQRRPHPPLAEHGPQELPLPARLHQLAGINEIISAAETGRGWKTLADTLKPFRDLVQMLYDAAKACVPSSEALDPVNRPPHFNPNDGGIVTFFENIVYRPTEPLFLPHLLSNKEAIPQLHGPSKRHAPASSPAGSDLDSDGDDSHDTRNINEKSKSFTKRTKTSSSSSSRSKGKGIDHDEDEDADSDDGQINFSTLDDIILDESQYKDGSNIEDADSGNMQTVKHIKDLYGFAGNLAKLLAKIQNGKLRPTDKNLGFGFERVTTSKITIESNGTLFGESLVQLTSPLIDPKPTADPVVFMGRLGKVSMPCLLAVVRKVDNLKTINEAKKVYILNRIIDTLSLATDYAAQRMAVIGFYRNIVPVAPSNEKEILARVDQFLSILRAGSGEELKRKGKGKGRQSNTVTLNAYIDRGIEFMRDANQEDDNWEGLDPSVVLVDRVVSDAMREENADIVHRMTEIPTEDLFDHVRAVGVASNDLCASIAPAVNAIMPKLKAHIISTVPEGGGGVATPLETWYKDNIESRIAGTAQGFVPGKLYYVYPEEVFGDKASSAAGNKSSPHDAVAKAKQAVVQRVTGLQNKGFINIKNLVDNLIQQVNGSGIDYRDVDEFAALIESRRNLEDMEAIMLNEVNHTGLYGFPYAVFQAGSDAVIDYPIGPSSRGGSSSRSGGRGGRTKVSESTYSLANATWHRAPLVLTTGLKKSFEQCRAPNYGTMLVRPSDARLMYEKPFNGGDRGMKVPSDILDATTSTPKQSQTLATNTGVTVTPSSASYSSSSSSRGFFNNVFASAYHNASSSSSDAGSSSSSGDDENSYNNSRQRRGRQQQQQRKRRR